MLRPMWRDSTPSDDDAIVALCSALNAEDPGPNPVPATHVRATLERFRAEPHRGRAVVYDVDGPAGYSFLVPFWSNELGGLALVIDELFVAATHRSRGAASALLSRLIEGSPWSAGCVALLLETTPDNHRARRLYERHGFAGKNLGFRRLLR